MAEKIYTEVRPDESDPIPAETRIRATLGDVQVEGKANFVLTDTWSVYVRMGDYDVVTLSSSASRVKVEVITEQESNQEKFEKAPLGTVVSEKGSTWVGIKISPTEYYSTTSGRVVKSSILGSTVENYTWAYPQEEEA